MGNPVVCVNMLGQFSISINEKSINAQSNQSKKPWSLLEYLITYRKREISSNELIDLIWGDEESSNPGGALKTLLFRSRKLLTPLDYPSHELIIQHRGSYAWNPDITTIVDADQFEELCARGNDEVNEREQLNYFLRALDLYKGDFLPKSEWASWVIPLSTYYHSLYQQCAHKTIILLETNDDWTGVIDLCKKAITIEPFDEEFHYHLIYALYKNNDQHGALEHYAHTVNQFYNEFAITPSSRLKDLYKLIRDEKHGITTDLSIIQDSLREETHMNGAFYCEYSVFRDIYQLESRAIERTGDSIYLCLLTISDISGKMLKASVMAKAMMALGEAISGSLRRGDAYTRYSVSQYLILLPSASYENGESVLKRIGSNFRHRYSRKNLVLNYSLQAMEPNAIPNVVSYAVPKDE